MNLESYLKGLSGLNQILRPYKGVSKVIWNEDGRIGVKVKITDDEWVLGPKRYRSADAFISAMWTFAEKIWEQLNNKELYHE